MGNNDPPTCMEGTYSCVVDIEYRYMQVWPQPSRMRPIVIQFVYL